MGRKLIDVPGRTFGMRVTNRTDGPLVLWPDCNGRTTIEQRTEELNNDLAADDFCTQNFRAGEAAFLSVLFSLNLRSLYQQNAGPRADYRQPATLHTAVLIGGAIWDEVKDRPCCICPAPGVDWTNTNLCSKPSSNGPKQLRRS